MCVSPGRHICGEGDTVSYKGQRCGPCDVLPLGRGRPSCMKQRTKHDLTELLSRTCVSAFILNIYFPDYRCLQVHLPVMLHSRRRHGAASPLCPLGCPSADLGGTGMVIVIGLWNFLLLGSTVTMGLKVALLPRTALTMSSGTGWA